MLFTFRNDQCHSKEEKKCYSEMRNPRPSKNNNRDLYCATTQKAQ